ncbi:hypothetical protein [Saccharothrix obliqua]|uniref:hypothetical protein n=1 Tax=Saccharothrix obliqua TaxID=2861747 RepID=UPI001C5F449C|nr:hypothetical protein [Saccharothrix obliqua]MBW4719675.1 hypothetical protein [Saccharothrix obliqua]
MAEQQYPVIEERALKPVPPRRFFGRPRGRDSDELPVALAGRRRVYRTRDQYVLDTDMPLDAPTVVEASHVSLVDVTADTEVVVRLDIPSRDAAHFTLQVAFLCTVHDPVAVVAAGGVDARAALSAYLKGHQRILQLGLDFDLADINHVRRKLDAQIRAYATVEPPGFAGTAVALAGVEVLTPGQVAELGEATRSHVVATTRLTHEHDLVDLRELHRRVREAEDTRHTGLLDAMRRDHARVELRRTTEAVAGDPAAALTLAHTSGEIGAKDLADGVRRLHESKAEQEHAEQAVRWQAEREDRQRAAEWAREDRHREQDIDARAFETRMAVVGELAKQGHLNMLNLRLDKLIEDVLGKAAPDRVAAGERREIEPTAPEGTGADDVVEAQLMEDERNTRVEE